eukprot:TRINITY_DN4481_c0_g1_i1.p3 TRINITY_DN4481_c0_g1~~TRINITY_DN4481_c0_g1_i1.p3  ORF type:complete len:63 (+),score=6.21 TRINITY_DN4481_c0_g1_i1:95-283(+)
MNEPVTSERTTSNEAIAVAKPYRIPPKLSVTSEMLTKFAMNATSTKPKAKEIVDIYATLNPG